LTALLLVAPSTPMLFQGQEFASSAPFFYFADYGHEPELARKVRRGRAEFLAQFRSVATREMRTRLTDPGDRETFEKCKLDFAERESHREVYEMHRDLLRLRREDVVLGAQRKGGLDGAVLSTDAFVLRFFGGDGDDRLLIVNLGADLGLNPAPEPLLAPPEGKLWTLLWSSEDPRYGGSGTPPLETKNNWCIPGRASVVMRPAPAAEVRDHARGGEGPSEEEEVRREAMQGWEEE
jgi:maltooligosyltrehalose trehalohydrolase